MINTSASLILFTVTINLLLSSIYTAQAQEPISSNIDCSDINIDYIDNPERTRSENISLMNKAFYDSLNKFELCNLSSKSNSTSSSYSSGGGVGSDSVANERLQGTEPEIDAPEEATAASSPPEILSGSATSGPTGGFTNGKIPEDIPPAANDDAIAAQIRLAAESEMDLGIRKKLWDEYRKYKEINIEP